MTVTDAARAAESRLLATRAQAGDVEVWAEIWHRYHDLIRTWVERRVHDHGLAEDITSAAFARGIRSIRTWTWRGTDLGAWLLTIARNLIADHFKSSRHRRETLTGDFFDADLTEPGDHAGVAIARDLAAAIQAALAALDSDDQRRVIQLRFFENLNVQATAAQMGRDPGAVKALQYRALQTLRRTSAKHLEAHR